MDRTSIMVTYWRTILIVTSLQQTKVTLEGTVGFKYVQAIRPDLYTRYTVGLSCVQSTRPGLHLKDSWRYLCSLMGVRSSVVRSLVRFKF